MASFRSSSTLEAPGLSRRKANNALASSTYVFIYRACLPRDVPFPRWPKGPARLPGTPDAIDILLGDGLQDDTAELVFQKLNLRTRFDLMFAAKLRRNH